MYHRLGNECFIIKQVFRKKEYFPSKLQKAHLWEDMTVLRGGASGDKNQNNFFVGIDVLNIFHLTIFSKKNQYFPK